MCNEGARGLEVLDLTSIGSGFLLRSCQDRYHACLASSSTCTSYVAQAIYAAAVSCEDVGSMVQRVRRHENTLEERHKRFGSRQRLLSGLVCGALQALR